jgi:hypothetical protein
MNPEIGFNLPFTFSYVFNYLSSLGLNPIKCGKSGIICDIGNNKENVILLRADMDALPVKEQTDLDFACENYTETRNKIFTQSVTINEPYIKDPYVGRYTWSPNSNNSANYVLDPRDIVASTDITAGYNGKSVIDALQEWSKLLDADNFNKIRETATGNIVTRPRDVLANKIYDSTYKVCYKYDDYTDNKG